MFVAVDCRQMDVGGRGGRKGGGREHERFRQEKEALGWVGEKTDSI